METTTRPLRAMTARYRGSCATCAGPITPGDPIEHAGRGLTYHAGDCAANRDPDAQPAPARQRGSRGYTVRTSTGWTGTRNYRGRCEDAPCCGCCTF